ncbi:hypothetical protein A6A06_38395 [Streptomyces sp. CB02923]|nr:hypothetical protein A6A06_38395 [Streptomyces sp. CB02923]
MREQFDQALKDAALRERAHVLGLWRGIAIEAADGRGDEQVRQAAAGTLQAYTLQEWERRNGTAG